MRQKRLLRAGPPGVTPPPSPAPRCLPGSSHPRSWRPTRSSSKPLPAAPAILWGHRDTAGGRGPGFVPSALRSTPGPAPRGDVGAHLREGASCLQEFAAVLRVTDPDVPKVLVFHDITALRGQEGETWERSPCTLQPSPHLGPQHCPCSPLVLAPRRQLSPTQPHVPTSAPTQHERGCGTAAPSGWPGGSSAAAPCPAQPATSVLTQPLGFRPSLQRPRLRGKLLLNSAISQCPSNPQHRALLSLPPAPPRKRISFHESSRAQLSPPFPRSGEQLAPRDALPAPHCLATARLVPPALCGAGRDGCMQTVLTHPPPPPSVFPRTWGSSACSPGSAPHGSRATTAPQQRARGSGTRSAGRHPDPPPQDLPPSALGRGTAEGLSCRRSAVPHFGFVRET